ncbi:MAG: phosphoribosylformylglycinamidine synthase subunit PurS [Chloroflexota bacterium]|nr:phosphoribosylformylglycinamidine synthase subunit PurS [Chloroflexota bacterium]
MPHQDLQQRDQVWLARVWVTLKPTVNDPQGLAIAEGLHTMGYSGVEEVRAGKYLEVRLRAPDEGTALRLAEEMSDRLLANTVIENYRCEVEPTAAGVNAVVGQTAP